MPATLSIGCHLRCPSSTASVHCLSQKSWARLVSSAHVTPTVSSRHLVTSSIRSVKDVTKSSSTKNALLKDDEPVVFTQSPAYREWKAQYLIELPDHRPPIQRPVCLISIISFMLYFFVFREENDLDELIYQPLSKTVPELELPLLEAAYETHLSRNLPVDEIAEKIAEVKVKNELKRIFEEREQAKTRVAQ